MESTPATMAHLLTVANSQNQQHSDAPVSIHDPPPLPPANGSTTSAKETRSKKQSPTTRHQQTLRPARPPTSRARQAAPDPVDNDEIEDESEGDDDGEDDYEEYDQDNRQESSTDRNSPQQHHQPQHPPLPPLLPHHPHHLLHPHHDSQQQYESSQSQTTNGSTSYSQSQSTQPQSQSSLPSGSSYLLDPSVIAHLPPITADQLPAHITGPLHAQPSMESLPNTSPTPPGAASGGRRGKRHVNDEEWNRQRKDNHKEVERRRRGNINDGINELSRIIPQTGNGEKAKGAILHRAVSYIHQLKENEARNIEKWTLEKLLMDQAVGDLRTQMEDARRGWEEERQGRLALERELNILKASASSADRDSSQEVGTKRARVE